MMQRPIHILVFHAEGIEDQYNILCLDFNIWSSIRAPFINATIFSLIEDAIRLSFEDTNPMAFEAAELQYWAMAHKTTMGEDPTTLHTIALLCHDDGGWHVSLG